MLWILGGFGTAIITTFAFVYWFCSAFCPRCMGLLKKGWCVRCGKKPLPFRWL